MLSFFKKRSAAFQRLFSHHLEYHKATTPVSVTHKNTLVSNVVNSDRGLEKSTQPNCEKQLSFSNCSLESSGVRDKPSNFDFSKFEGLLFAYLFLMERAIQKNGSTLHEREVFDAISRKLSQPIIENLYDETRKNPLPKRALMLAVASMSRFEPSMTDAEERKEILSFLSQLGIYEKYIIDVKKAVKSQSPQHYLQIMQNISPKSQMGMYVQIVVRYDNSKRSIKRAIDGLNGLLQDPMDQVMNYKSRVQENSSLIIESGYALGWSTMPCVECPKLDTATGEGSICMYCSFIPLSSSGYLPSILVIALNYIHAVLSTKLFELEKSIVNTSDGKKSQETVYVEDPDLLELDRTNAQSKANILLMTRKAEHAYLLPNQPTISQPEKVVNTFQTDEKESLWDLLGLEVDSETETPIGEDINNDVYLFSDVEGWLLSIVENPPQGGLDNK